MTAIPGGKYIPRGANGPPKKDALYSLGSNGYDNASNSYGRWNMIYGSYLYGKSVQATWADVAEMFKSDCHIEAGKLVMFGGELEVTLCDQECSTQVIGIVSEKPALKMNSDLSGVLVALMGQVPCLIYGKAKKGQRIIASRIPGVARAIEDSEVISDDTGKVLISYYSIIGRMLEDKDTDGVGLCKVVVGVK